MKNFQYIIVGAEVDAATHFLQPDGSISETKSDTPLDVEFIGRKMVELSRMPAADRTPEVMQRHENEVRFALQVHDLGTNEKLSAAQKAAIVKKTVVKISFEARHEKDGDVDTNERILIIPADGTLAVANDKLSDVPGAKGFTPALTYELDGALALAQMNTRILKEIANYGATNPDGWTEDIANALMQHLKDVIGKATTFAPQLGTTGGSTKEEILKTPRRAFHRAVGIYGTNMCR